MKCANCQSEINSGALVCPSCHTDPIFVGSQPYDGVKNAGQPSPHDPELTLGVIGTLLLPVFPVAGASLWGLAGLSLVAKWWKNRKE
jgi:hypothetical protein